MGKGPSHVAKKKYDWLKKGKGNLVTFVIKARDI